MKKFLILVIITASSFVAMAEPTTNFFTQVFTWGTSFDTNSTTFLATRGMFDTGVESRIGDGLPLINDIHASYDVVGTTYLTPTNVSAFRFGPDVLERNSGVTGTFVSAEGGIQAAIVHHDFRFGASLDGGYWSTTGAVRHHMFGEASLDADKAIGSRAYIGTRFSQEFPRSAQGIYAKLGFTF